MKLNPYLTFNGECEAAFKFYEQVLDGKSMCAMTWGEMPGPDKFPAAWDKLIMHATLSVGDEILMGADAPDGYQPPKGINVALHLKDIAKGERIFNSLAENGSVQMPFQQTFWSAGFGMCTDRFGIPWMISCERDE